MSRNRCRDSCCGNVIKLSDLVGKPLEFRKYFDYAPKPGVKWQCPTCKKFFFVTFRIGFEFWSNPEDFDKEYVVYGNGSYENTSKGKFAKRIKNHKGEERAVQLGYYQFDTSYYETYNDEGEGVDTDNPSYKCEEDDERTRLYIDER